MSSSVTANLTPAPTAIKTYRQSDLASVLTCGRRFELEKIIGMPRTTNRKMLTGTAFHKGLETIYRPFQIGDRADYVESEARALEALKTSIAMTPVEDLGIEATQEAMDALVNEASGHVKEALAYYIQNVLPEVAENGRPVAVEEPLELEYRGLKLTGILDLVDGARVIRDHKLTFDYLKHGEMPTNYWAQLARYSWLWAEAVGEAPKGVEINQVSVAKLKNKDAAAQKVEHVSFRDNDVDTLIRIGKELVDQAIDQIERGHFPRNGMHGFGIVCKTCSHRGAICLGTCEAAATVASPAA